MTLIGSGIIDTLTVCFDKFINLNNPIALSAFSLINTHLEIKFLYKYLLNVFKKVEFENYDLDKKNQWVKMYNKQNGQKKAKRNVDLSYSKNLDERIATANKENKSHWIENRVRLL